MSILIKGMEMPTRCEKCDLAYDDDGYFACPFTKAFYKSKQRPSWCPLIELPPHGRLIDADDITEHKFTTIPPHRKKYADGKPKSDEEVIAFKFGWNYAIDEIVENAPTIIEAEVEDG